MSNYTFLIDGKRADVSNNIDFTRIYRGAETTDTKKNNYSLTVKLPFTFNNELIFKRTNSLTYKSNFPYEQHTCNLLSDGVSLIKDGTLHLLATTDCYECAITWENIDYIGIILNNTTKLGQFLVDFPFIDWNYSHYLMDKTYSSLKADEYGYLLYNDGGGDVGTAYTHYYSYQHPMINFKYLLQEVFDQLGITVNIPTAKNNFLLSKNIRPNKEYDIYTNNIFEAYVDATPWAYLFFPQGCRLSHVAENTGTSPYTPSFGRNSYYFKSWIDSTDGEDAFFNDVSAIPQPYRFKSFANSGSTLYITDFNAGTGDPATLKRWEAATQTWSTVFTVTGNGTYTFLASEGDWFAFEVNFDNTHFKVKIETTIDGTLTTPNELRFPSVYHIPTCIDLTVGEFIKEALALTGSQLTYDVNTAQYSFSELTKQNASAYDITQNITNIKEITYDTKYIYSKLAQSNVFKYLNNTPIDADYSVAVANTNLEAEIIFIDSKFSPSSTQSGGTYNGNCVAVEHSFPSGQIWTQFTEQPLHILFNNTSTSKIYFDVAELGMDVIFNTFYLDWFNDLEALVLTGSVRLVRLDADMTDVEFKRINPLGLVYIKTFGKYYSIIEISKNGNDTEFFLLELY